MSLGPDIKEVIAEVGSAITIFRSPANITGEFIKAKVNAQVTKPFIREFFLEGTLSYDTQLNAGDVVQLNDGRIFLVMNKTPITFEGSIYSYSAVLYKSNVTGSLYRLSETKVDYRSTVSWSAVVASAYALLTENQFGNELDDDGEVGKVSLKAIDCYLPRSYGAIIGDRFEVSSTEYYQVEDIKLRRFDNIDLITLGEDTRGPRA